MRRSSHALLVSSLAGLVVASLSVARAQVAPGDVVAFQKVSALEGGFGGTIEPYDQFGYALACLGDLNGDTVPDLAVGAPFDDVAVENGGTLWILFPRRDGTIKGWRAVNALQGGLVGLIDAWDFFGAAVAPLGDVDGDGVVDLAVGAPQDDDGGTPGDTSANLGAVWVLFMNANGSVKAHAKISMTSGGFGGTLGEGDRFGGALAGVGDLDGNGVPDLAVGAYLDDGAGPLYGDYGALWTLLLASDGSVVAQRRFAPATLALNDRFARGLAALGDLDGDGRTDLAVGASGDDTGATAAGAVWLCALASDGGVEAWGKITAPDPAFAGRLDAGDHLGYSLATVGDLDRDGVVDLAAGANGTGDAFFGPGAVWILHLDRQGGLRAATRIGDGEGGGPALVDDDFGAAVAGLGDHDLDGVPDLAVGASMDGDGGEYAGALYVSFLSGHGWLALGGGAPGTHGTPTLAGDGVLAAGDLFTLALDGARANAAVLWLAGLDEVLLPFHGGTLVPSPALVLVGAPTDGLGAATLSATWPAGVPHGLATWWQAWIDDPLALGGWAGSRGVQGVTW